MLSLPSFANADSPASSPGAMPQATFLATTYQCRELSAAVARLAAPESLITLQNLLEASSGDLRPAPDGDISDQTAQVVTLVLKDVDQPEYPFPTAPTAAGVEALAAVRRAVFGGDAQPSLMQSVLCGTLAQARRVLHLCTAILLDSLAPHTCLAIYGAAAGCNCAEVAEAARSYGLRRFTQAAQLDYGGLTRLPAAHLLSFLCSDDLQVASELDPFAALVAWTEFDPQARLRGFARRLTAAVRFPHLSQADLVYMDSHPLVSRDKMATQVVAHAYLSRMTGLRCDAPFGMSTLTRPRAPQPQPPTPPRSARADSALPLMDGAEPQAQQAQQGGRPSALAQLLQSLVAEPTPATPVPAALAAAAAAAAPAAGADAVLAGVLNAPTPEMRGCDAASPAAAPAVQQQAGKARDMLPASSSAAGAGPAVEQRWAARRSLFSAGLACCSGGDAPAAAAGSSGRAAASLEALPPKAQQAQRAAPAGPALTGLSIEMMLSPSKQGIRDWLDAAEAVPPPNAFWASKKRLRFE